MGGMPEAAQPEAQAPQEAPPSDAKTEVDGGTPLTYKEWLGKQDEHAKRLISENEAGLRSALETERKARKDTAKQLGELAAAAEEGSSLRAELDKLKTDFALREQQTRFYETAPPDVTNLRLAWLAAEDAKLVDKDGDVDWKKLRAAAPELFRRPTIPASNAGNGSGQQGQGQLTMNDLIRGSAGKR